MLQFFANSAKSWDAYENASQSFKYAIRSVKHATLDTLPNMLVTIPKQVWNILSVKTFVLISLKSDGSIIPGDNSGDILNDIVNYISSVIITRPCSLSEYHIVLKKHFMLELFGILKTVDSLKLSSSSYNDNIISVLKGTYVFFLVIP